jgi:subtilisin family serine protease
MDHVTFADLPVAENYVAQITALGAEHRRDSKWLNASSFEVTLDQIDVVAALPFVAKVRPVAVYNRPEVEKAQVYTPDRYEIQGKSAAYALNYGASLRQLEMLHVPAMHDLGYNGSGVVVAMFDGGFYKDHEAFSDIMTGSRLLDEYDFVFDDTETQNELEDQWDAHYHGTYTWSTLGGSVDGVLYGPAYGASFLLAKTEDVRSETQVEEDNLAAAVEWANTNGVDVISISLGYSDWYTYSDFDGETAISTIAVNTATDYGIVVCNSMGNAGPAAGTITPPADGIEIVSVGAVDSLNIITNFSSRGPTFDGRMKPEVCAQGRATFCAYPITTTDYARVNGTSLSCPLIGGAAAVILSARPDWTPQMVRRALMENADKASTPDNTYGWGLPDLTAILDWGVQIDANETVGYKPFTVDFADSSYFAGTSWSWTFGDGDGSPNQNPSHQYDGIGVYDVTLTVSTAEYSVDLTMPGYITVYPERGDADGNGTVNISDAVHIVEWVFKGGPAPDPLEIGNSNCDGNVNIADGVFIIDYVFKGGPAPGCP